MKTFKHSGDIGDLIYALPTIRALGGGKLYLAKSNFTRVPMQAGVLANIKSFLESQPYVTEAILWQGERVHYNLDLFRDGWDTRDNIAEEHLKTFGIPVSESEKPWLENLGMNALASVVINRTKRHRNDLFPWNKVLNKYVFEDTFVGTKEEFNDFSLSTEMPVLYNPTETLLDLAQVISGCKLFIGNQSAAYAIAEGLKKPVIQEVYLPTPNCIFRRPNAQFVTGSEIELPELSDLVIA